MDSKNLTTYQEETPRKSPLGRKERKILLGSVLLFAVLCVSALWLSSGGGGSFPVYISEILASNTCHPNSDGRCCDYIELHNRGDHTVDLSGFQLGDIAGNNRYRFPAGTILGPGEYLVVYCDKLADDPAYAPFGISRGGGEPFYLLGTNNAVADSVVTIPTDLDQPMVRIEDGSWSTALQATPGRGSEDIHSGGQTLYNPDVSPVRITEISSAKTGYSQQHGIHCDWVELCNTGTAPVDISGYRLTDNVGVDKYIFPQGTVLNGGEYLLVLCTDEIRGEHLAPFNLSQIGGESVILKNAGGMIVEIVDCIPMNDGESLELTPDNRWTTTGTPSPGFPNGEDGHKNYLKSIGMGTRSVVISEVMASGQTILPDAFGEFSDWVELYNQSEETVDLSGWYLSDNPQDPRKWAIPQLVLEPGQRIVIYCSGRDTLHSGQTHTSFSLSSRGETLTLSGYTGIAADTVTLGRTENNTAVIFPEGAETEYPTPGYSNDDAGYEQFCAAQIPAGPLAIWEVMTSNDWYLPQNLGQCYDWVELRNISDQAIRLSDYAITDDPDTPEQYVLPDKTLQPGASIVIILSGDESLTSNRYPHAGFSLNAAEDQLLLYSREGALLDHVRLKSIPLGYSFGRMENEGGFFHMDPSPNAPNQPGTRQISAMPTSEVTAGVYTGYSSFTLPLSASGDIYYTTDGSDPDETALKYQGPIQVEGTGVIRAIAVEPGKLPSKIYTATFVEEESHSLPVLSLVTDPGNLWGSKGIYKNGNVWIKDQKRSANVSYTGADGSFSLDCEISLHGMTSVVAADKKSFSLRFQDSYGGRLHYDLFEDGEVTSFKSLILRNGTEDNHSSNIRDVLVGHMASSVSDSVISQKHKYVVLYINGVYWGVYSLRELHSEEHYASYADVPAASVTMRRDLNHLKYTDPVYDLIHNGGSLRQSDYETARTHFDLNSAADWLIFQAYVSNIDIMSNARYYYSSADGLWRWGLVDLDLGMFDERGFTTVLDTPHHGYLMRNLLVFDEFRDLLARRMAELLKGPLSDENMIATIDSLAMSIRDEMPREYEKWAGSVEGWEASVTKLKNYCDGRAVEMIDSLCGVLQLSREERQEYFGDVLAVYGKT